MAISAPVGRQGRNERTDVKLVQILLNLNLGRLTPHFEPQGMAASLAARAGIAPPTGRHVAPPPPSWPPPPIAEDGGSGKGTIGRIEMFQRQFSPNETPSGTIQVGDALFAELRKGLPIGFSDLLRVMMPMAQRKHVERYHRHLSDKMTAYEINTPLRQAHFLAQLAVESSQLRDASEWASGEEYEGRTDLGNTEDGDGVRFKGRGLIQLTGRSNYVAYGKYRNRDYVTPDNYEMLADDAETAVDSACWYWTKLKKLNEKADSDDVLAVSIGVNGVNRKTKLPNGFPERVAALVRTKYCLGVD